MRARAFTALRLDARGIVTPVVSSIFLHPSNTRTGVSYGYRLDRAVLAPGTSIFGQ